MMTLASLGVGKRARVVCVNGDDAVAVRLMEMGVIEGVEIELLGRAPLGDPMEFRLPGYRLSLRRREAGRVEVVPLEP
jgi:ferrous iron transport protein A